MYFKVSMPHLEHPAGVTAEAVSLDPRGHTEPYYQDMESKQLYLIHRNKHREAAKMRRQRNMAQVKEQIKTLAKELNEMVIGNLSDTEFKTLVFGMLKELSDDLNSTKKIQLETKYTLIEIKNNLQENNSRVDEADNQIRDMEHKKTKNHKKKKEYKKMRIV